MKRKADALYERALKELTEDNMFIRTTGLSTLHQVLQIDPGHVPALLTMGELQYNRGNAEECLPCAYRVLETDPENLEGLNLAGKAYLLQNRFRRARRMFLRARRLAPEYIKAAHNLPLTDYMEEKLDRAIKGWEKALTIDPEFELTLSMLVEAYGRTQNAERAIFYGERLLSVNPDHFDTVRVLSQLYFAMERYGEVVRVLKPEFKRRPILLHAPSLFGGLLAASLMPQTPVLSPIDIDLLALSYLKTDRSDDLTDLLGELDRILEAGSSAEPHMDRQVVETLLQPVAGTIESSDHPVLEYIYEFFPGVANGRRALPILADTDTFLRYVRDENVEIVRGHGIAQARREELNRRFVIKEPMNALSDGKTNDARFRFLEALLLDAGYVQYRSDTVALTEEGARYLALPPREQFERLFETWLTTRRWNELFEIENLYIHTGAYDGYTPEDDAKKDLASRRRTMLKHLRDMDRDRVCTFQELIMQVERKDRYFLRSRQEFSRWEVHGGPLDMYAPPVAEWEDIEARVIGAFLTGPCSWFQLIVSDGGGDDAYGTFIVTPLIDFEEGEPERRGGLTFHPSSEIHVDLPTIDRFDLREIERFSMFKVGWAQTNVYGITETSVAEGISQGIEVERFLDVLERNGESDVPDLLRRSILSWAAGSVISREITILRADESVADTIAHNAKLNRYVVNALSATTLEVDGGAVRNLAALVEKEIGRPRISDPALLERGTTTSGGRRKADRVRFDQAGRTAFSLLADVDALLNYVGRKKVALTGTMVLFPKKEIKAAMEDFQIRETITAERRTEPDFPRFAFIRHLCTEGKLLTVEERINPRVRYRMERREYRVFLSEKGRRFLGAPPEEKLRTLFGIWRDRIGWNARSERADTPDERTWSGPDRGGGERDRKRAVLDALAKLDPGDEAFADELLPEGHTLGDLYVVRMIQEPLCWLGVVDVRPYRGETVAFRITDEGGWLLGRTSATPPYTSDAVKIEATGEFVLEPEAVNDVTLYEICRCADLIAVDRAVRFRITPEIIDRARDWGRTTEEIRAFFETLSATPIPQNVATSIQEWGERYGRAEIRMARHLRFQSEESRAAFEREHPEEERERLSSTELIILS